MILCMVITTGMKTVVLAGWFQNQELDKKMADDDIRFSFVSDFLRLEKGAMKSMQI
jgi:hypothetical protein